MPAKLTLEEVAQLAGQLPAADQLKLAARICEEISITADNKDSGERIVARTDAWLAECDRLAETIDDEFDSADELQQIREKRMTGL